MASAPRSKRDPAQLAEIREQARKARTNEWLARTLVGASPLSQARINQLRVLFAPVQHLTNGA